MDIGTSTLDQVKVYLALECLTGICSAKSLYCIGMEVSINEID